MADLKEQLLFAKIKKQDREAFIEAYDLYNTQIYRFIYFKIGNYDEANDITSAVFLKAWNYIQEKSVEKNDTLKSLFYKIARNTIIDEYRKNSKYGSVSLDNENFPIDIKDEKNDLASESEIKSDVEFIEKKLLQLKDECREVIILKYIDQLSIGEIAKILDKSHGAVRVLLHRSMKTLRELVGEDKI
jgi:RNA polymerase sigma-70 factor (ECF subfamily)